MCINRLNSLLAYVTLLCERQGHMNAGQLLQRLSQNILANDYIPSATTYAERDGKKVDNFSHRLLQKEDYL